MNSRLKLDRFLPYRLARLAQGVSRSLARVYAERFSLSVPQWRVLASLAEQPGITSRDLAALTDMDKVKVSRAVADLEGRRLLRRRTGADRRSAELRLSPGGEQLYREIVPLARAWERRLLARLGRGERAALLDLIEHLEAALPSLEAAALDRDSKASERREERARGAA